MKGKGIVFLSLAAAALFLSVTIRTKSEFSATSQNQAGNLVAGRNVNMVSGKNPITGDPYLQRQNEPSIAVSTVNHANLFAGANDYRTVDMPGLPSDKVPGDAWLGVFKSRDGGESWTSGLLPGYPQSNNNPASPLFGFDAAADPTVRAGVDGLFFYSGIAFQRIDLGRSVVFVARYKDFNDVETGDSIRYLDTTIIDRGNTGQFTDKPWIGVDIPRDGHSNVYLLYSIFLGELDQNIHSKIMFARSTNSGNTWEMPIKLSEGQQKNQGTIMAIDPNDGTIYVAWRRFASVNVTDAILIARSTDFGQTFTKAVEVATISRPFDQPTMGSMLGPAQFRTDAFPALAVDSDGRVYLAWTQRDVDPASPNDARIIITSKGKGEWGQAWPAARPVETLSGIRGHQFMPSMTFGAGKLMLAWYDTRYSARYYDEYGNPRNNGCTPGLFITDDASTCPYRETVDVRAAQASPGTSPNFEASTQVSRYLWVLDASGTRIRQAQFNPADYQLYAGGLWPFHADYLDIAPSPAFVRNGSGWRFNQDGDPFLFYVTWTDNRDVRPPDNNIWINYTPPASGTCLDANTGMRNQNVYCSKLTRGIEVGTPVNNKSYGAERRSFMVYVNNTTDETKSFTLTILNPPSPPGSASFSAESSVPSLSASAPSNSTISRMVFVQSSQPWSGMVQISEVGDDFVGYVQLNLVTGGDTSAEEHLPTIIGQETINWTAPPGGTILNPNIVNPNIVNPNIVNPNIVNPNIVNPNIVNPNIVNPNIVNPNIVNPNIVNPNIVNPNIVNAGITDLTGAVIIDKTWTIKNTGSAVTAYTFKNIAGESLPENFYVFAQLLIFKVHRTPAADGCALKEELHHELLVNITSPNLSPDISSLDEITDPDVTNDQIWNATFSLGPGEEALVILRIIDTKVLKPTSKLQKLQTTQSFDPAAFANNVGAVVISQAPDPSGNRQVAITLMILPDALPDGLVGKEYHAPLRVIGGTQPFSWSLVTALPPGLLLNAGTGEISGNPTAGGDYPFTVQVQDSSDPTQSDTQQFLIHIDERLIITTVPPIPNGIKYQDYSPNNFKFEAIGGHLPYTWSWTGAPTGLNLNPATGAITGTPAPLLAGNFTITVQVTDKEGPKQQVATKDFELCILKPIPMDIAPTSLQLPDADLGSPYSAIFTAINAEGIPGWQATWVTSQPLGLQVPPIASAQSIELAGVPLYDKNAANPDYPNSFKLDVLWTDAATSCEDPRTFLKQYNITINPRREAWARSYEGAGDDQAKALAVDPTGSVYVTGYITNPTTGKDFYTIKYGKNGAFQAAAAYNGPLEDQATAIAVRGSYVYVTGFSTGGTTGADFFTIKYDTSLNKIWQVRYDGPAHLGDFPSALAVDSLGNVYVTGYSYRGQQLKHADYETIKYDGAGKMVWEAAYDDRRNGMDQATAIALLEQGNTVYVYVTGKSQDSVIKDVALLNYDYYTLKYDSLGKMLYQVRTDGPAKGDDEATSLIVDSLGNAYVTGRSKGLAGNFDIFTVKYNSFLIMQQSIRYDGGYGDDEGAAIAFGPGNTIVYVTGSSRGSGTGVDIYTAKYDTALNKLFDARYDGRYGDDKAFALAVDSAGNAYVGGFTTRGAGNTDALTLAYDTSLNLSWLARYDSAGKDDQFAALALYVDSAITKIYLTGFKTGNGTLKDFVTVKY